MSAPSRNIDVALLRAFVAVVETGSVTRAANLLSLTQAAVSQQIKRLEELFGAELFDRGNRALRTSADGERLLPHAQSMLTMNDAVWGLMSKPHYEGELRVGVPHDVVEPNLPPVLKRFDRAWPRVHVTLTSGISVDLLAQLEKGELDVALSTLPTSPRGTELLLRDPLVWAGVPGGQAHLRHPLPVSFGSPNCAFRASAISALSKAKRDWRPVCEATVLDAVKATVYADTAIAPMLLSAVPADLHVLDDADGLPALPPFCINMHLRRGARSALAEEFASFVRQEFVSRYGERRQAASAASEQIEMERS
jgi:DNA-binding transcriptional LysR family regulator